MRLISCLLRSSSKWACVNLTNVTFLGLVFVCGLTDLSKKCMSSHKKKIYDAWYGHSNFVNKSYDAQ